MNCFAIEEDDQFEIAAIHRVDRWNEIDKINQAMQAVENLTKHQYEGTDYFHPNQENHNVIFLFSAVIVIALILKS